MVMYCNTKVITYFSTLVDTYIPRTHGFDDINMSPAETKLFTACRSMQNIQSFHYTNGVNKYVCKYCAKLDQQNCIIARSHPYDSGTLITKPHFFTIQKLELQQ